MNWGTPTWSSPQSTRGTIPQPKPSHTIFEPTWERERSKRHYDQVATQPHFTAGLRVWVEAPSKPARRGEKFASKYNGPFRSGPIITHVTKLVQHEGRPPGVPPTVREEVEPFREQPQESHQTISTEQPQSSERQSSTIEQKEAHLSSAVTSPFVKPARGEQRWMANLNRILVRLLTDLSSRDPFLNDDHDRNDDLDASTF